MSEEIARLRMLWSNLGDLWLRSEMLRYFTESLEMAKQQQQQNRGLPPSVFAKYMTKMTATWEAGKAKAKEGAKAVQSGQFYCRVTKLYPKEFELKKYDDAGQNGKVIGKCLGVVAKLVVVVGDHTGSVCWADWKFKDDDNKTADERFQDFQKDLVKMGMENIEEIDMSTLTREMENLAKRTPAVKISRVPWTNGQGFYTNIQGSVDEDSIAAMGGVPIGNLAMGGASAEPGEPVEPDEPHEPEEQVQAPTVRKTTTKAAPTAAPAAASTARPPRGAPEPVELDLGGEGEEEPGLESDEPPLEEPTIEIGSTVQYKYKGVSLIGTIQAQHSSGVAWIIKDNNSTTKHAIKFDDPSLALAD